MKKLREVGMISAIGFLLGTLGQIGFWRHYVDLILNGYKWLPFAIAPVFAFVSAWLMVGKISFHYWSETDNAGNKSYNVFLAVLIVMFIMSLGISLEAILEA
jgi:hypothetical protein